MKKLIDGIVEFRKNVQESYREAFGRLAIGQAPDTLFFACSDSRVVPNTFASTNPGDLFVLRNVGNLVPPSNKHGHSSSDESEVAALEFAVNTLQVSDIVVCGHSECGAMKALVGGRKNVELPHLKSWLRHGEEALEILKTKPEFESGLTEHNRLSQINVLVQMKHIESYPIVRDRIQTGALRVHGWWFDIARAEVYYYDQDTQKFVIIDEHQAEQMLRRFDVKK